MTTQNNTFKNRPSSPAPFPNPLSLNKKKETSHETMQPNSKNPRMTSKFAKRMEAYIH